MAIKLKKLEKKLHLFKKILGDEFLAVSAIILFESFMKLGYGVYSVAITLLIVAASSFMAGVTVKGYTKNKC